MIRYRTGRDARTGRMLRGFAHVEQSIGFILTTFLEERVMLLEFGAGIVRHLGRNITPALAIAIYRDAVKEVHRWEPEYRIRQIQLVTVTRTGTLGLGTRGLYYPEGRFGNYDIVEPADGAFPFSLNETRGDAA